MTLFVIAATPFVFWWLALFIPDGLLRRFIGPVATLMFFGWLSTVDPSAEFRLLYCSVWLLSILKGWSLLKEPQNDVRGYSKLGLFLYSCAWPGMDPVPFSRREASDQSAATWFAYGFPTMCGGIAAFSLLALNHQSVPFFGLAAVFCILTIVHLGFSDILSSFMRLLGFPVNRLFEHPLACSSLRDFWSNRWNRPFVEMNRRLFQPVLRSFLSPQMTVPGLFIISGLLHELALSYPAGAGFGGPLLYFFVQGVGMTLERKGYLKSRIAVWAWLLIPVPLLFHSAFLGALVEPLVQWAATLPPLTSADALWSFLLTAAAYGHFLVLVASFQVPYRLDWGNELPRLRPLNRKLLWTYGAYIASFILLWGVITLYLLEEMLNGDKSALVLVALIALFWWSRIIIDTFYFEHSDWPEGAEFVLGHTCLTTLFITLASTYTGVLLKAFVES